MHRSVRSCARFAASRSICLVRVHELWVMARLPAGPPEGDDVLVVGPAEFLVEENADVLGMASAISMIFEGLATEMPKLPRM